MFGLALLFVYVFFCHFSILITLLWEEGAGLCTIYFFSSSWCRGWLRLLLVALPGLFYLPFCNKQFHNLSDGSK